MTETTRLPTEMEVQSLLRNAARTAEDEAAVAEWCQGASLRWRGPGTIVVGTLGTLLLACGGGVALAFLERRGQPIGIWVAFGSLAFVVVTQSIAIGRLTKVTTALARMSERSRAAEPLPRASRPVVVQQASPSPPAGP